MCVTSECKSMHEYLQNSQEWILKGVLNEKVIVSRKFGILLEEDL